ncbi:MAG: flavin reductase [Rikenellaceae bacterium]|jgi:flavin reductase (DIM6/NTAB) family NADH-FMN oxidoreductase RutF|nr:flavin reductase [Rikenellaceae bacterium]
MRKISPTQIEGNLIELIGRQWMLITAGDMQDFNTMTASWGAMGELWKRRVAIIFIRPQRHTLGFVERSKLFTLSFFDERYRGALNICGTKSGRDCDKVGQAGLTPCPTPGGSVAFDQACLIIECRKIYADCLSEENFIDKSIVEAIYPARDLHKLFIGEILNVFV